ncbi:probable 3-hydroxyisobutyrate dehydrogenase, mitochondrial isoform X2 [Rosa rugosa]|uniref:probable 3-hydroxyisobutyrate dehydrogenase, mitochondrial isoform X2 n=1 Tax=Rosa rugosa TaxID=74645 RepID=UPI002B40CD83|nr:probable 3-hydroxyisobutyrate dehydrogenase, mitochondrial isoform X2 [Rosa rugosa]
MAVLYRVRSLHHLSKCISTKILPRRFYSAQVSSQFETVGFIGLGNMGSRMANNLIKAGYQVAVHDINCNAMKKFSDIGAATKETPTEVAEASDVVITMLPTSSHVYDVYTGPNGLLYGGNLRPRLFIDSSTIDPQTSRKLSTIVSNCTLKEQKEDHWKKPALLDAPVSGGVLAAEAGTLTFMVGGSEEAYMAAEPLFLSMGKNTVYCGGAGNGSCSLLEQVFLSTLSIVVPSIHLCDILPLHIYVDSYNPVPGVMEGVPSSRNYDGGFASKLMAKDVNIAATSAKEVGLRCPLTCQAQEIYTELCEDGHETKDFSCVFRHYYSGKNEI